MTFLLIMSGRSFLREAICSFFCSQMPDVDMILVEGVGEVPGLCPERTSELKLVLLHVGKEDAGSTGVLSDLAVIRSVLNGTPTVLLGQRDEPAQSVAAIQAGARGYIPADMPADIIKHALPLVAGGGVFAPPFIYCDVNSLGEAGVAAATESKTPLLSAELPDLEESHNLAVFTERELEVLKLLGTGLPNKLIAHHLGLKEGTVKVHMRNVMKKLKVSSRTQAALYASRHFEAQQTLEHDDAI